MLTLTENQQTEFKENWRDEYLKWLCGFANTDGGTLYVGVNDKGEIIGVENAAKLLEDLPNKIRDSLGILANVQIHLHENKQYIQISINAYPYQTINYKGDYFQRSGSTNQHIKGVELEHFLFNRAGVTWDNCPIEQVSAEQLSESAIQRFREKVEQTSRVDIKALNNEQLLDKLHLYTPNHQLTRAAILLFHETPEYFIGGAFIKIAAFGQNEEMVFQDIIQGSIMQQIDKTMDLLKTKYLFHQISFHGTSRHETFRLPEIALRETLLNAIAHKDYSDPTPTQIKVYPHKIVVWNAGRLPTNWSAQTLWAEHHSKPFNPKIANALFYSGDIESWGSGYGRIARAMQTHNLPQPEIHVLNGLQITYYFDVLHWLQQQNCSEQQMKILAFALENGSIGNTQVQELLNVSKATSTRLLNELNHLLEKHGEKGRNVYYTINLK